MSPKYNRNPLKRMTVHAVFQDGQYVNLYSPERKRPKWLVNFGWWLQTVSCSIMFGAKGWQTYINSDKEAQDG